MAKSLYFIWQNIHMRDFLGVWALICIIFWSYTNFPTSVTNFNFFSIIMKNYSVVLGWALKNPLRTWLKGKFWISFYFSDRNIFRGYTCQFLVLARFFSVDFFLIVFSKPLKSRNENLNRHFLLMLLFMKDIWQLLTVSNQKSTEIHFHLVCLGFLDWNSRCWKVWGHWCGCPYWNPCK